MPRLAALLILALFSLSPPAQGVIFQAPGQSAMIFESRSVQGTAHIRLDDLVSALRAVDSQMTVTWDSTQTLRLRVLGTRVSLFTDSDSMLVEARLHRTAGPLINRDGEIYVPASVLSDLFELLPAAPEVAITLPESTGTVEQPVAPTPTPLPSLPQIPSPDPEPQPVETPVATLPSPRPSVSPPPGGEVIALVVIPQREGDEALLRQTLNNLASRIEQGTGRTVEIVEARGDWDQVGVEVEALDPVMVIGLLVGHSAESDLRGAGVYHMSPAVDTANAELVSARERRYRAGARLSEILAMHLEYEIRRAELAWLGRLPAPHRLLRILAVPAVLIEVGQAGNAEEADALAQTTLSTALAGAIAQAVIDFHSQLQRTGAMP